MHPRTLTFRPGPETTILVVLVLTLALSGVLAYHAHRAAASHRLAAEAALRDYAAFAGWQLERRLADALPSALEPAARQVRVSMEVAARTGGSALLVPARPLPERDQRVAIRLYSSGAQEGNGLAAFEADVRRELRRCECAHAVSDFFHLDLPGDGSLDLTALPPALRSPGFDAFLAGASVSAARSAAHRELVRRDDPDGMQVFRMIGPIAAPLTVRALEDPASRLVYTFLRGPDGEATAIYGFRVDVPEFARPIVRSAVGAGALLPPSLTGKAANGDVLAIRISTVGGDVLYASAHRMPEATAVSDTLRTDLADVVIEVGISPEAAQALVIGGLPRSRLPLLLGLFGVTLGLVGVATVQLRRQRMLTRLRSDFVSGVSHELRTPLAQIQLFAELLDTDRLSANQRQRSLRIIGEESRRLAFMVQNVLQFSGSERQGTWIAPEPTHAAPLIRDIVESFAPLARSREVTIHTRLDERLWAPLDRSAARQVLVNLLDNAVKYGPRGQSVEVTLEERNGGLCLAVTDEGPGVPPSDRARIWEPYRRLRRDAESATGGSGIGLAVVRELVDSHGGQVSVTSAAGGGARFEVWLPGSGTPDPGPDAAPAPRPHESEQ